MSRVTGVVKLPVSHTLGAWVVMEGINPESDRLLIVSSSPDAVPGSEPITS